MDITRERDPKVQVEGGDPFPVLSARVDWELDRSYLRRIIAADGKPLALPVGAKITLYTGPSVVFQGRVQEDQSVLDLLSCEGPADDGYVDL